MRRNYLLNRIKCFLLGHNIVCGEKRAYESDYCKRCWLTVDEMNETGTLPCFLNRAYGWLVDKEWSWFDSFDLWLISKCGNKGTKWWKY